MRAWVDGHDSVSNRSPVRRLVGGGGATTLEGCESGRIGTLGKRVWGNSPWVRIPLPPPSAAADPEPLRRFGRLRPGGARAARGRARRRFAEATRRGRRGDEHHGG